MTRNCFLPALLSTFLIGAVASGAAHHGPSLLAAPVSENLGDPSLSGLVVDAAGQPAADVLVVSDSGHRTRTAQDGRFEFPALGALPPGPVRLTAFGSGTKLVAGTTLTLSRPHGRNLAGTLQLQTAASCNYDWIPAAGGLPGADSTVSDLAIFDDGRGPAVYLSGSFRDAGGVDADRIARWDGSSFEALDAGLNSGCNTLAVFDDGSGPALYAGGFFTNAGGAPASRIARWDGATWTPLGLGIGTWVSDLAVFDDGGGAALFATGDFTTAGGAPAQHIARWDGTTWAGVGGGLDSGGRCLWVHNDGSGDALFVGGPFKAAGGIPAGGVAKWDGSNWSALGTGLGGLAFGFATANDMATYDDGSGSKLYVGGQFATAGGINSENIAAWDGNNWSSLAGGMTGAQPFASAIVFELGVFDSGSGEQLVAGGSFLSAGGTPANSLAEWDGSTWTALKAGVTGMIARVESLVVFPTPGGPRLIIGGNFPVAGRVAVSNLAQWDGNDYSQVDQGLDDTVRAIATFDDGSGPALYIGGEFDTVGGIDALRIAKWDGATWSSLSTGINGTVFALHVFDDGAGPALFAGGDFTIAGGIPASSIAKWDGSSWTPLGLGITIGAHTVYALEVFDDGAGPDLIAGGVFAQAGLVTAKGVASWDGSAWTSLTSPLDDSATNSLKVFDDGNGQDLYVGGSLSFSPLPPAQSIARWDGSTWTAVGLGLSGFPGQSARVLAMEVGDLGSGDRLYAGGHFTLAEGAATNRIAAWDGSSWSSLGFGVLGSVNAMAMINEGSGPALYVGGDFTFASSVSVNYVARWDGSGWSALGDGPGSWVYAMDRADFGHGDELFVGGLFSASAAGDSHLARWGCNRIEVVQGCVGNPANLGSTSPFAQLGGDLDLSLDAALSQDGLALLFAGSIGTNGSGCGVQIPGLGEVLIALAPEPTLYALTSLTTGHGEVSLGIPSSPALAGLTAYLQAAIFDLQLPTELTNALSVTLFP